MNHLGLIAEWKDGCAMTTKSKTMPECLVPCPLRTSYRGTLPSLMCSLHWKVCEYKSSVGENKVKWKAGCAIMTMTMPACLARCPQRTSYRGTRPSLMCSLHWMVCEYEDSVGWNKVEWKAGSPLAAPWRRLPLFKSRLRGGDTILASQYPHYMQGQA